MEKLFDLFYLTSGVCTDTRKIKQDSLFIALKGANFDGNEYVEMAIQQGAKFAITEQESLADNQQIFHVEDCLIFLQKLANFHRKKFNIPVIGITGSNGKTTTKELVHAVLSAQFKTLCTQGNLNNHLGVPFTLLELNEQHEMAIIEMGANKPGDIQELVEIAEPTCGLITGIGAAHIEGFGSLEGVIKTKSEMYNFLKIQQGLVFVNGDDEILNRQLGNYFQRFTYGEKSANQVQGSISEMTPFLNFTWQRQNGAIQHVAAKMIGSYNLINYLCAAAIGVHFGLSDEQISNALKNYTPSNNRSQVTKTERNTLILDAYNANITSMKAAIESFEQVKHERKCVILGDMRELGALSSSAHQEIVDSFADKNWQVILVGEEFGKTKRTASMTHFDNAEFCLTFLQSNPISDAFILIKGSRGIALEKVVQAL